ncbi:hypothetical protein CSKR_202845 [Clonorchis sinensis]|uniref:Pol-related protein n=1 Tax=Clonorchis sinensis TaxID=79923 RepID=A0A3R7F978_CLOSI|nr:hypothetical protein CSKR_202845 [Clonorchis sinensis]
MPTEGGTRAGKLPGCPSLDRSSRDAEVGLEPRIFGPLHSNNLSWLFSINWKKFGTDWEVTVSEGLGKQSVVLRNALLIRLLEILRQPTTGFAFLGAHQFSFGQRFAFDTKDSSDQVSRSSSWPGYKADGELTRRKTDVTLSERVQRAATKTVAGLKFVNQETRLAVLDLSPLEYRRFRGDLILTYVLFEQGLANRFFTVDPANTRRGHVVAWNNLPPTLVHAPSRTLFKALTHFYSSPRAGKHTVQR